MDDSQTQQATQRKDDPRRLGRTISGLSEPDSSDVFCILIPSSLAAIKLVAATAVKSPQHVLQYEGPLSAQSLPVPLEEQDTFKLDDSKKTQYGVELALRFSSRTVEPWNGFRFGRNSQLCDIVFNADSNKRLSNRHFRIYINENGIVMIQDTSTNGTMVDDVHLKANSPRAQSTRMLQNSAIIQIISTNPDEVIKFMVKIPAREDFITEFSRKFHEYKWFCQEAYRKRFGKELPVTEGRVMKLLPLDPTSEPDRASRPLIGSMNTYGMRWNGGDQYNIIGQLGKGAFATVYKLATKLDGKVLAAKELEKRRFIKNGNLDQRLDNEMRIMQGLRHPSIVQYIDYRDIENHLYIIMEYVPYGDLQGYLAEHEVLAESKARRMARQVLEALAYLHEKQITHRDIKPDNILIASLDPFEIKLTDFGLSKVVKNNETFLKTFCGTLLYCAPEVFPHYDAHVSSQGTKRRRGSSKKTFHSYSQSVDVWSFAAVLWFALCGEPPFKGVTDATGKGMFDQIMATTLDTTPLQARIVSDEAIDLLVRMLDTDPARRPTEGECLQHPWLNDGTSIPQIPGLKVIEEEWENDSDIEDDAEVHTSAGAEQKFSQLSIHGRQVDDFDDDQEPSPLGSSGFESLMHPHPSKRFKSGIFPIQDPNREHSDIDDSSDSEDMMPDAPPIADSMTLPQHNNVKPRLFGEISESALQDSGVLGAKTHEALALRDASTSMDDESDFDTSYIRNSELLNSRNESSLHSTDSRFRDMDITTEPPIPSNNTTSASASGPPSPKTPEGPSALSVTSGEVGGSHHPSEEETPKAPAQPFTRRINLPPNPSSFYDPRDPSTHTLEYASQVSGINFLNMGSAYGYAQETASALAHVTGHTNSQNGGGLVTQRADPPELTVQALNDEIQSEGVLAQLPDTMQIHIENPTTPGDLPSSQAEPGSQSESQFAKPRPRLGRLTTVDSFASIIINLDQAWTSFGRLPTCTVQYRPLDDIRIPKKAFEIWFHHDDLERYHEEGRDWSQLEGLRTGITTWSTSGIYVNGVHLKSMDRNKRTRFGHIHTGDVVTVFKDPASKQKLQFKVEIFKGEGAVPRQQAGSFVVHYAADTAQDG